MTDDPPVEALDPLGDNPPPAETKLLAVFEQASHANAIGMKGPDKVDAAVVCQDENTNFNLGVVNVWMDIDQESPLISQFKGPTTTMDGRKIGLALSLRIDGKTFTPKEVKVLGGRPNGKPPSLIGSLDPSDDLFAALQTAKRVEIIGNDRILMVDTEEHQGDLVGMVMGCRLMIFFSGTQTATPPIDENAPR